MARSIRGRVPFAKRIWRRRVRTSNSCMRCSGVIPYRQPSRDRLGKAEGGRGLRACFAMHVGGRISVDKAGQGSNIKGLAESKPAGFVSHVAYVFP